MNLLQVDTIRAVATYTIALLVIGGGGLMLFISRADTGIDDLRVVVAGFIGSALTFVFGQEVQTRTARQGLVSSAQASREQRVANGTASEETLTEREQI
jgi:class 3 adenylate cyclase